MGVAVQLGTQRQAELDELLTVHPVLGRTRLSWLGTGPVAATPCVVASAGRLCCGLACRAMAGSPLPGPRAGCPGPGGRRTPVPGGQREVIRRW